MKKFVAFLCVAGMAGGALVSTGASASQERSVLARARIPKVEWPGTRAAMAPPTDRLIVEFEDDANKSEVRAALGEAEVDVETNLPELEMKVVEVEGDVSTTIEELEAQPAVAAVEPDEVLVPMQVPNDPFYDVQWGLNNTGQSHPISQPRNGVRSRRGNPDADVDAPEAWAQVTPPADDVIVAVLDAGFDVLHQDLIDNVWVNADPRNGIDDDGNGFVDDTRGWDFADKDRTVSDPRGSADKGHGTHVAGIVAATSDNNSGISGVCPMCKVLPLRWGFRRSQEMAAINYVIDLKKRGENIVAVNASFGGGAWSRVERSAIAKLNKNDILLVAAAGNGGLDNDMFDFVDFDGDQIPDDFSPAFPASYSLPNVLTVAATNDLDRIGYFSECDALSYPIYRCLFSNYGRNSVDVGAPGVDIKSLYPRQNGDPRYATFDGTSMAAPLVSGTAGLVAVAHPTYSARDIKNAIMNGVDQPGSMQRLWREAGGPSEGSFLRSNGRVNAADALVAPVTNATQVNDGTIRGAKAMKGSARANLSWPGDVNDVWKKYLIKGRRYRVTLDATRTRADLDLSIWKPNTKDVWQYTPGCEPRLPGKCAAVKLYEGITGASDESITFKAPKTGRFYLMASTYFASTGYTLKVARP